MSDIKLRFTGAYPVLATGLEVGQVDIDRQEGQPPLGPTGSTVVLYPGDVLTVPADFTDRFTIAALEVVPEPTLTVKEIEEQLDALHVDRKGVTKKADLLSLLTESETTTD